MGLIFGTSSVVVLILLFSGFFVSYAHDEEVCGEVSSAAFAPKGDVTPDDKKLLAFPLNLEYLETEFFAYGALGYGLDKLDPGLAENGPAPKGAQKAKLDILVRDIIAQFALQEVGHLNTKKGVLTFCKFFCKKAVIFRISVPVRTKPANRFFELVMSGDLLALSCDNFFQPLVPNLKALLWMEPALHSGWKRKQSSGKWGWIWACSCSIFTNRRRKRCPWRERWPEWEEGAGWPGLAGVGRGSLNLAPGGLGHGSEAARGGGAPGGGGHGSTLGGGRRGSSPGGGGHGSSPGGAQATSGGVDPICKIKRYLMSGESAGTDWLPPECDISIRPGWFWHRNEAPKSLKQLLDVFYKSSARNCLLLLNVPPNSSGLIGESDFQTLERFSSAIDSIFSVNLAANPLSVTASSIRSSSFGPQQILDECMETFWAPMQGESTGWIELDLGKISKFNALEIREPVNMGQRVMEYHVEAWDSELGWYLVSNGSTIGYRKVDRLEEDQVCAARLVRLLIDASRGDPLICFFGLYFDMYNLMHLSSI
ncbi:hypothetical protein SELMODRAFT_441539 [Selaginella moellendorffii]|uniref:F5/8 type C domain-containing protein n=1 Tax=Selaginella moellendorffii TaxID=88036 RepID=D8RKH9_SELML|nr:hypothetical protein SELMODRAFT_441539 [Selaginella moellendorffii]